MTYTLIIFPTPLDAVCVLQHDTGGWTLTGVPALHPSGRPGQAFAIPEGTPNRNGARLTISHPTYKDTVDQRAVVLLNDGTIPWPFGPEQSAAFAADDFILQKTNTSLPRLVVQGKVIMQDVP